MEKISTISLHVVKNRARLFLDDQVVAVTIPSCFASFGSGQARPRPAPVHLPIEMSRNLKIRMLTMAVNMDINIQDKHKHKRSPDETRRDEAR